MAKGKVRERGRGACPFLLLCLRRPRSRRLAQPSVPERVDDHRLREVLAAATADDRSASARLRLDDRPPGVAAGASEGWRAGRG